MTTTEFCLRCGEETIEAASFCEDCAEEIESELRRGRSEGGESQ